MWKKTLAWLLAAAMWIGAMSGLTLVSFAGENAVPAIGVIDFGSGEAVSSGALEYIRYACGGAAKMGITLSAPEGLKAIYAENEGAANVQFTADTDALQDADGNITFLVYYYATSDANWSWMSVGNSGANSAAENWTYRAMNPGSFAHPLGALPVNAWSVVPFTLPASAVSGKTVYLALGAVGGIIYVNRITAGPAAAVAADHVGHYDDSVAYVDFNNAPYPTYMPGIYSLKMNKAVWAHEELETERGWVTDAAGNDISSAYANVSSGRVTITTANGASENGNRVDTDFKFSAEGVRYLSRRLKPGLGKLIGEVMLAGGAKTYKSSMSCATYTMPDDGVPVAEDIEATLDPNLFYSYTYVNLDDDYVAAVNSGNWIIRVDIPKGDVLPDALQGDTRQSDGSVGGFKDCGSGAPVKVEGETCDTYYYICTKAAFSNKSNGNDFRFMIRKYNEGIAGIAIYPYADKTALAAAITAAGAVSTEGKSEAVAAALADALADAKALYANAGAAQYECKNAIAALKRLTGEVEEDDGVSRIDFTTGIVSSYGKMEYSRMAQHDPAEIGITQNAPDGTAAFYVKNEGTANIQFELDAEALKDANGKVTVLVNYYNACTHTWAWMGLGRVANGNTAAGCQYYRAGAAGTEATNLGGLSVGAWDVAEFTFDAAYLAGGTLFLSFGAVQGTIYVAGISAGPATAVAADKASGHYDDSVAYVDFDAQLYPIYMPGIRLLKEHQAVWGPEELEAERGWFFDGSGKDISSTYAGLSGGRVVINTDNGASDYGGRTETDYQISAEGVRYLTRRAKGNLGKLIGEVMLAGGAKEYRSYLSLNNASYKMPANGVPVAADIEATLDPHMFYSYTYVNLDDAFVAAANTPTWIVRVDMPKGHREATLQCDTRGDDGAVTGYGKGGCTAVTKIEGKKFDSFYYSLTKAGFSNKTSGKDFRLMITGTDQGIVGIAAYPVADKAGLAAMLKTANGLKIEDKALAAALTVAVSAAETVKDNEFATQGEVDAAAKRLKTAIAEATVPAYKTALAAVIASVPKDLSLFTAATVNDLNAARQTAQAAYESENAGKEVCDKAAANLQKAIDALHNVRDDLQAAVDAALTDLTAYTAKTAQAYADAREAAVAALAKAGLTAADCAAAIEALEAAAEGLLPAADKAALQAAVDAALTDLSAYTDETADAYRKALDDANTVLGDTEAAQAAVDAAAQALEGAAQALVLADVPDEPDEPDVPDDALGDVNGDGGVDSTDARLILQYYAQKIAAEALDLNAADVNGDGGVDSTDARLILQLYAQKITSVGGIEE